MFPFPCISIPFVGVEGEVLFVGFWVSLYTGMGDWCGVPGWVWGWSALGLFWCEWGTGLVFVYLCWGMSSISLYGRDDFLGVGWVVRVSLTVPCNPSRVVCLGISGCCVLIDVLCLSSLCFYPRRDRGAGWGLLIITVRDRFCSVDTIRGIHGCCFSLYGEGLLRQGGGDGLQGFLFVPCNPSRGALLRWLRFCIGCSVFSVYLSIQGRVTSLSSPGSSLPFPSEGSRCKDLSSLVAIGEGQVLHSRYDKRNT